MKEKANIILLTENSKTAVEAARRSSSKGSVSVMDLSTYLQTYHPNLTAVAQLYDSLNASLKSKQEGQAEPLTLTISSSSLPQEPAPGDVYPSHLPESALIAGIRSGQFLQGVLRVSRFRSTTEAIVVLTE